MLGLISKMITIIIMLLCVGLTAACADENGIAVGGPGYTAPLDKLVDAVLANPTLKPLPRKAISPKDPKGPLQFKGQESLTKPLLEAYLDRAISHMYMRNKWDDKTSAFLKNTGSKYIHWADLVWGGMYNPGDWQVVVDKTDAIHSTDWGQDIIFECGVMEIVAQSTADATPVPDWMLKTIEKLGLQEKRIAGPNGKNYFSYEAMFDRNASDWPEGLVGRWSPDKANEQSVPDLTMLETQLYYAYLISEYIDAGYEAVMFGQAGLTGKRDKDNIALNNICNFAKRWAAARGYRRAVALTSHVIKSPDYKGKPIFTHLTFPSRLRYTMATPIGIEMGPELKEYGRRHGGKQIKWMLENSHDLPILLEIDNYGRSNYDICDEAYDEITAYANKNPEQRAAFLRYYYFDTRKWKNAEGNARVHLAPTGYRDLTPALSLYVLENGEKSKPTSLYLPFKEDGGEEETIKELFQKARNPKDFKVDK